MAFEKPITIKSVINNIDKKEYFLPAIQREFVWKTEQIEKLFDSLMRDYPISSFLFWKVKKENINKYKFYEFLRDYHEKDRKHNSEANISSTNDLIAILDGQQRLTSLYIGLKGSYSYKVPRLRWENPDAFPCRKLYLNLLNTLEDQDLVYDFKFLTGAESTYRDKKTFWFPVGEILKFNGQSEVNKYLIRNKLFLLDTVTNEYLVESMLANDSLFKLYTVINENPLINYYLVEEDDLNKVLDIFVRVNNGGTKLNHSDLLLSMVSAQWKDHDARKEITSFVDDINKIGNGFSIDKDFVMRSCLILCETGDFSFKVENFTQQRMSIIEKNWEDIQLSIKLTFQLLSELGYNRDTLTSNTAISIIVYYIYKINNPINFVTNKKYSDERSRIRKFLIIVMLKHTFGGQIEKAMRNMCSVIDASSKNSEAFPLEEIIQKQKGNEKNLDFEQTDYENILRYEYGNALTYSVLSLLYPKFDFKNKFHQDHIHPKSLLNTRKKLDKLGISQEDIGFYIDNYNTIANLQLLDGSINEEKSNELFDTWFFNNYKTIDEQIEYKRKHYIPDCSLDILNFKEFITKRNELLLEQFKKILG